MRTDEIIIVPKPKKIVCNPGNCTLKRDWHISLPREENLDMYRVGKRLQKIIKDDTGLEFPIFIKDQAVSDFIVCFSKNENFASEEYSLDIENNYISIQYKSPRAAFHAVSTLKQITRKYGKVLPNAKITDSPDFEARGLMVDISRNKIPKMETLYRIIDLMADLKLNQFQLYIEGFSYAYASFPDVWKEGTPISGEEMLLLDRYCSERFIDFVPNQNSFGHMLPWLEREEFKHLAECPDGFEAHWGRQDKPLGLCPTDEASVEHLEKMYADLLPYFSSEYCNICCDETFDLGLGKSREQCNKLGKGTVYLNFLLKINEIIKKYNKKMMFWGDIIVKYPEMISRLPMDAIALEWGYDADQPSEENCRKFEESGVRYYVCPGTNTWNSITGRTDCMKKNLLNAATLGKKYGASGFLNTEWGDCGHWQPLPSNYASYVYGAALSWDVENNKDVDIAAYLDCFVFEDRKNVMGKFVLDLGNYYLEEKRTNFNGSGIFRTLYYYQLNNKNTFLSFLNLPDLEAEDFNKVKDYVICLTECLDKAEMKCKDADLIDAEFRTSIKLILHGANLGLYKLEQNIDESERRVKLKNMLQDLTVIIKDYKYNWLNRNRSGGLEDSITRMKDLQSQYKEALEKLV